MHRRATVLLLAATLAAGCASTREPQVVYQEVPVPVPTCPEPPQLPPLELPRWPDRPPPDATPSQRAAWYAAVAATAREWIARLEFRITALERILAAYRSDTPRKQQQKSPP